MTLFAHELTDDARTATLVVDAARRGEAPLPKYITGKFCEHLYDNIYNGMYAQILRNPTFGDFPFCGGGGHPDGGVKRIGDEKLIAEQIRSQATRMDWPEPEKLLESRADGLAHFWVREGPRAAVWVSPDAGPVACRAQRVEVAAGGQGVAQWVYLPLHRVRRFEFRLLVRSDNLEGLVVALYARGAAKPCATAEVHTLSGEWQAFEGAFDIPAATVRKGGEKGIYRLAVTAPRKGQFVIAQALLFPADHIDHCDPDIIRMLKESRLPLLRWPGGNFVSGYHWRDGVGPIDRRPTRDNPAWANIEPNLFGTDEFIAFCRAVGCEPMICVNAGNGTPAEAADWVEYCNGAAATPMGGLRVANGHPEPFNIRLWEIGNELSGTHQTMWTTPAGYADRCRDFAAAMLKRDAGITLLACGAPVHWGGWDMQGRDRGTGDIIWTTEEGWDWNRRAIAAHPGMRHITDHILVGGRIPASADPREVCRDFMAFPVLYEEYYRAVERIMRDMGVKDPRMAITELQLFGGAARPAKGKKPRLTNANLVTPSTMAEAVYQTLFYHMTVRLAPFVPLITHSATVNHGGGLRKHRERVYGNPCHYSNALFSAMNGATACAVELTCGTEKTKGHVHRVPAGLDLSVIDAVAGVTADGATVVSIVHRGIGGPVRLTLQVDGIPARTAAVSTLAAKRPWDGNTPEKPRAVVPVTRERAITDGKLTLTLAPCSVTQVRFGAGQ